MSVGLLAGMTVTIGWLKTPDNFYNPMKNNEQ
jgi:hypothetical protein